MGILVGEAMPKITVCTQVYNTKPFLVQCIESVLNQTFQDFEYLIVDNGCTDGSQELLKQYAAQDSRINLIRYEENVVCTRWLEPVQELGNGTYFANLDSDDWWEPDYLEKLLAFAERYQLDIACTGTVMHILATGAQGFRSVDRPLVFPRAEFAKGFSYYHVFLRTVWAKLIRMELLKAVPPSMVLVPFPYGTDTLLCFQCLRRAQRIGINNDTLQHYRIMSKSGSYQYNPQRFDSDIYLYNDTIDFLSDFGPISAQNRNFLQCVYSNAVIDTMRVIQGSRLSPADKLREYRAIATHPITLAAYQECTDESATQSKAGLIRNVLEAGKSLGKQDNNDLLAAMQVLLPRCGQVVSAVNAQMFLEDAGLLQALLQDDKEAILQNLLVRMEKNQGTKKYPIPDMIRALALNDPLLCQIDDAMFLRRYAGIYRKVWKGEYIDALDEMTGLLLENKVRGGHETFLHLYTSIAALKEQAPAFVFGKLQLGWLYLHQGKQNECWTIVDELTEMGVDNEELSQLHQKLEELPERT